jgi:glutamate 5-kinase
MLDARLLLLLSDVDGLFDRHPADVDAQMIPRVDDIDGLDQRILGVAGSVFGSGGMASKVEAARIATLSGADVVVAPAGRVGVVSSVVVGEDVGTWFPPGASRPDSRKRWIAFAKMPRGRLRIDAGAVRALVRRGSSLLAAGIIDVTGDFAAGDAAEVVGPDGQTVARGLVAYNAEACRRLRGKSTDELDADHQRAVIHRDSMVVLARPPQPTAGGGTFGTHTV